MYLAQADPGNLGRMGEGAGHNYLGIWIEVSIYNRIKLPRRIKYDFHAVSVYICMCQVCIIYFMPSIRAAKGICGPLNPPPIRHLPISRLANQLNVCEKKNRRHKRCEVRKEKLTGSKIRASENPMKRHFLKIRDQA